MVDAILQTIKDKIFAPKDMTNTIPLCGAQRLSATIEKLLKCYKVPEENQEEDDPRNAQIPKNKADYTIEGLDFGSSNS